MSIRTSTTRPSGSAGFVHWSGPAFAFFAIGLLAGAVFTSLGGIPGVRALGVFALLASAFGMVVVAYTLHTEDPDAWAAVVDRARALIERARSLPGTAASTWRVLLASR